MTALIRTLRLADHVSLFGIIPVWASVISVLGGRPILAIVFHLSAFVVDCLDGWVARRKFGKTNTAKDGRAETFGLQLDTIIDALNYPFFCALFSWKYLFDGSWVGHAVACAIIAGSALRLSRMATNGIQHEGDSPYYEGVVTPHLSFSVIMLFLAYSLDLRLPQILSAVLLITLSVLMTSGIKTYKPKKLWHLGAVVLVLVVFTVYLGIRGINGA